MRTYPLIKRIWSQLNNKLKLNILFAFLVIVLSAFADMISIASVLPFLGAIVNPRDLFSNNFIKFLNNFLKISEVSEMIFVITAIFLLTVWLSTIIRLLNLWTYTKVASEIATHIGTLAYQKILFKPYKFHIINNSSGIINKITIQIDLVSSAVKLTLQLLSSVIISLGIISFLLAYNFKLMSFLLFTIFLPYFLIVILIKPKQYRLGKQVSIKRKVLLKIIQESLNNIKDVIIGWRQFFYIENYLKQDSEIRTNGVMATILSQSPKFLFEAIGISSLVIIAVSISGNPNNLTNTIKTIGVIALGAQKLLPYFQQCYASWSNIKNFSYSIDEVLKIIEYSKEEKTKLKNIKSENKKLAFKKLELRNINFRYEDNEKYILKNINLSIYQGEKIGIIGRTGCGKSTLLNILMGLIKPTKGKVLINDLDLYDSPRNLYNWHSSIAQVPQNIALTEGTIYENIAFGVENKKINKKLVKDVSQKSGISEFIESKNLAYNSLIGEQGINLSVGQKQRIGIARALYNNVSFLILDEATSAIDNKTEKFLIESIEALSSELTIVMVAHRLSSLKYCDRILEIDKGSILRELKPTEL